MRTLENVTKFFEFNGSKRFKHWNAFGSKFSPEFSFQVKAIIFGSSCCKCWTLHTIFRLPPFDSQCKIDSVDWQQKSTEINRNHQTLTAITEYQSDHKSISTNWKPSLSNRILLWQLARLVADLLVRGAAKRRRFPGSYCGVRRSGNGERPGN